VIQFRDAELIAPGQYRLRGLLRGQAGTESAMAAGAAADARFVLINAAIAELGLGESERGLPRVWAYGPARKPMDDPSYAQATKTFAGVGLRPLSPVHLRAARGPGGDITLSWIRRTRLGGDAWDGADVPLAEESEAYVVEILSGGEVVRQLAAVAPGAIYDAAMQAADFGTTDFSTLTIRVAQRSASFGRGAAREATLHV
jgi:hypothetical protein